MRADGAYARVTHRPDLPRPHSAKAHVSTERLQYYCALPECGIHMRSRDWMGEFASASGCRVVTDLD